MRHSSLSARLVTTLIALLVTPVAMTLLSVGGSTLQRTYWQYSREADLLATAGPAAVVLLGVALILVVVATGIWSSAGLIAAGGYALIGLLLTLFPAAIFAMYGVVPYEWTDGILYGTSILVLPLLPAMGFVLMRVRRDPRPARSELAVTGAVLAPVLLAGGAYLIAFGVAEGPLRTVQQFRYDLQPLPVLAMIGGLALVAAAVVVVRWSPFALVLPGVVLVVGSILMVVAPMTVFPAIAQLPRGVNFVVPAMILHGGAGAAGAAYLAFTVTVMRVKARGRRGGADAATAAPFPGQGPVGYPYAQPGGPHAGAAGYQSAPGYQGTPGYPAAPGYPVAPQHPSGLGEAPPQHP